tara:strand:- start:556 stop:1764 length:1209 start_codon:yes stop_codon:yes gene_type:complete
MILEELKNNNIIKNGSFELKSGEMSNVYIDIKKIISFPSLHLQVCNEIAKKINPEATIICGTPYGAVSFTSYISITQDIPMIFLRKEPKEYGTKKIIEGMYSEGEKVILIEDVVTTGSSVIEAARKLEENGLVVSQIITIFSRSENLNLKYKDIPIEYLYHISQLSGKEYELPEIIREKKSNICLAADVRYMKDLRNLVELVGKYICILKVHSDIIVDFHKNYEENRKYLNESKELYNFKIWEDRKFADIGHIMNRQVHTSISDWADIISVHPIAGKKSLDEIKDIDIFLISEMSSDGHLMTQQYQDGVLEIAESSDRVIGVVCQHKMPYIITRRNKLLHIVPGISLNMNDDNEGQTYSSPEERAFADIYVIGRGIYESDDPVLSIKKYLKMIENSKKIQKI